MRNSGASSWPAIRRTPEWQPEISRHGIHQRSEPRDVDAHFVSAREGEIIRRHGAGAGEQVAAGGEGIVAHEPIGQLGERVDPLQIEIAAQQDLVEALINELKPQGIVELVRTGVVAMGRGVRREDLKRAAPR